ncbi:MAG TPA: archaellin/type IV pilin N-terminal domain-containing protein [Methanomassiliicoccales archaeon]|nr:archaellin/type IV pilin N-terminal domain-containing protein [Methanomassiliicoccales archaeon]
MNKKWLKMKSDKRAEMGIGTMIIFIAMVLVAAVAASVLISTANTVREQAQSTGEQAIKNVASGFVVQDMVGSISGNHQYVQEVYIYLRLAAGSPAINMENVIVDMTTPDSKNTLLFAAVDPGTSEWSAVDNTTYFGCELVQGVSDAPWTADTHIIGTGDMLKIYIGDAGGLQIGYNELVTVKIIPAYGQPYILTFVTGESFMGSMITLM